MMKLQIFPPEDFSLAECIYHLRHLVRTRAADTTLRKTRRGYIDASGPVGDLMLLKFLLPRYGYRLN
jgi:hypothetical protein